jgi:hypothetical protein
MTRDCAPFVCRPHGNPVRPCEPFTLDQCRSCWLEAGGDAGTAVAGVPHGVIVPARAVRRSLPCVYLGREVERTNCPLTDRHECDRGEGVVQRGGRCQTCRKYDPGGNVRRLRLENRQAPGDALVMTAAVEMLHEQYPGEFLTEVVSPCPAVWENNPHVAELDPDDPTVETVVMEYPLIHKSDAEPRHFLEAYVEFLAGKIGKPLRLTRKTPALYLSEDEKGWLPQVHELTGGPVRYWVINSGWKDCFTAKWWPGYQDVVDALKGRVQFVQVGELSPGHHHPPLAGVIDLRGKTDTRQLIRLCYHADGAVGPTTFLQHIMAALDKPYVCLLGGREPVSWVQYPLQTTLHSVGALDCCRYKACWKSRTVPLGDGNDDSLCDQPVDAGDRKAPRCMTLITPAEVVAAVERYEHGRAPV